METLLKDVEPRLQKGFTQLRTEIIIFERLMYKNANQHRRALYFRRLCQVRRDLRLLQSAHLADLIQNIAQYFGNTLKEPSLQKGILQSKSTSSEIQDLKGRMYGVAKLMEQMSDPILHASSLIAGLLGQTFFMPFALTTFSILARLRVLVLQCLHDIVDTFNLFSAWALEKGHFDTDSHDLPAALECKWDGIKLSLGATFTHHQQDICVENDGFVVEDCNGRKYSVLGSLVSGDTAWEHEQAKEMIPSTDLIAKANGDNEPVLDIRTPSIEKTDVCNSKDKQDGLIQEKAKDTGVCIYSIDVPKKKVAYVSVHSPFRLEKEKKEEELHPPKRRKTDTLFVSVHSPFRLDKEKKEELHPSKRRKTDALFDMLLGLGDGTHKYIL